MPKNIEKKFKINFKISFKINFRINSNMNMMNTSETVEFSDACVNEAQSILS